MRLKARLSLPRGFELEGAARLGSQLGDLGFTVQTLSKRGISFEGDRELFESTFGLLAEINSQEQFASDPTLPVGFPTGATVYFPTKPEFFGA